jgi:low molecular weight protein-tyrosine phosphatase
MSVPLPPPRDPGGRYRIGVVCLGNICRSPIAEVVLSDRVARAGLDGRVEVVSSGTGDWHIGGPMDRRAATVLTAHGYDASQHRAQQFDVSWFDDCDLILTMDADNFADVTALGPGERVRMFREFDPCADGERHGGRDVPDPYYGGDDRFSAVLAMVERTADTLVAALGETVTTGSTSGAG